MSINLSALKKQEDAPTDPRAIFMALNKEPGFEYPRDVQSEVWEKWHGVRKNKNAVIKMNTGSGKTTVGLVILQSCINEGVGPAVYVAPNKELVHQVIEESHRLGIEATEDEDDYLFLDGKAIFVTNIHKLFNGKSVFGISPNKGKVEPGSILIDDVHACLDSMREQFRITIEQDKNPKLYKSITRMIMNSSPKEIEPMLERASEAGDRSKSVLVPFYTWQNECGRVEKELLADLDKDQLSFKLPLLSHCFPLCSCVIKADFIEIAPRCVPASIITGFDKASRRIFMSATLANDGVLSTAVGLAQTEIANVICPNQADDIGNRSIAFPQALNPHIKDERIMKLIAEYAKDFNVTVIVPSKAKANKWKKYSNNIADKSNIRAITSRLRAGEHLGISVFINQYNGIDLPGDACRIVVIDGLPKSQSAYDSLLAWSEVDSDRLTAEKIQKIEQGMGRGVRSSGDYCAILLMGSDLAAALIPRKGNQYFSDATKRQYDLSKKLWDQIREENRNPSIEESKEIIDLTLKRDKNWIEISKEELAGAKYKTNRRAEGSEFEIREAFDLALHEKYPEAVSCMETKANSIADEYEKGFLKQVAAEYANFYDKGKAQEILLSAWNLNQNVTKPIRGITHRKRTSPLADQAEKIVFKIKEYETVNEYIIDLEDTLSLLNFGEVKAQNFEKALKDFSFFIGIESFRPEQEEGRGPDNLWALGENVYLVIECKNEASNDSICKKDCNQLNGSIAWFNETYGKQGMKCVPVVIHPSKVFDFDCAPCEGTRVITKDDLQRLRDEARAFEMEIGNEERIDTESVKKHLNSSRLRASCILSNFTSKPSRKRR